MVPRATTGVASIAAAINPAVRTLDLVIQFLHQGLRGQ
jgi:hypothetical protein